MGIWVLYLEVTEPIFLHSGHKDMNKRLRIVTFVLLALVGLPTVYFMAKSISRAQGTSLRIAAPFSDVVFYLSGAFQNDLTKLGFHGSVRGVPFLSIGEMYYVEVYDWVPGKELSFQARMGQIGNEYNTFLIRRISPEETDIFVNNFAELLFLFTSCHGTEHKMLDAIKKGVAEQNGSHEM